MDCTQSLHIAMCTYDIVYYVSVWCGSVVVHVLCVCMYVIVRVYLSAGEGGETTICPEGPVAMKRPQCILRDSSLLHVYCIMPPHPCTHLCRVSLGNVVAKEALQY